MDKNTYTMQYQCFNCKGTFTKEIKKGQLVIGNSGECPYCGIKDDYRGYMDKDTYTMQYQCFNCKGMFTKEVKKGQLAIGGGGECPYCGVKDDYSGGWSDSSTYHIVIGVV